MRKLITISISCLMLAYAAEARAQTAHTIVLEPAVPLQPAEQFDFVFVTTDGVVTRQSVGDPDGDGFTRIPVPPQADGVFVHAPDCLYDYIILFESPARGPMLFLKDLGTGDSLLLEFGAKDLPAIPQFPAGETFAVVNGVAGQLPGATIRAPGIAWGDITDEQLADAQQIFPLFTGTAIVGEVAEVQIIPTDSIPALSGWGMGVILLVFLVAGWLILGRAFASTRSPAR